MKLDGIADAQVGNRDDAGGNVEDLGQSVVVEDADPADSHALYPSCEPEVLNGSAGAVKIGFGNGVTPEDVSSASAPIACDADVERAFGDAFQLERIVQPTLLAFVARSSSLVRICVDRLYGLSNFLIADDDEVPGLHVPYRSGVVRCP